jgi:hypothetical protein
MELFKNRIWISFLSTILSSAMAHGQSMEMKLITVKPKEYGSALRNPLKGFRDNYPHPYGTVNKTYIPWNELENKESDGLDKIRAYCNQIWKHYPEHNVKAIPRVWLYMPPRHQKITHRWASDMKRDDYSSPQFKSRVVRLVKRLGQCWDHDPRIAYVEMGIIGKWGEQHSPWITPQMQKLLGDAFSSAFENKLVMIRHATDFPDYQFGIYWDSWAHYDQINWDKGGGSGIRNLGDRWKMAVIGGETAYDWGNYKIQPGDNPTDTVTDLTHRTFLIDTIRELHCNHLGWLSAYDRKDSNACQGAEEIQKALGYRFVIEEVQYPRVLPRLKPFNVSFTVRNVGSSPFYYPWPVEISLLNLKTKAVVWKNTFKDLDIRKWLPGDQWNKGKQRYALQPRNYKVQGTFRLEPGVRNDGYILALAILDPAGMVPSVRFAIQNYFKGGRHPICKVGVGTAISSWKLNPEEFDDPAEDRTLHYVLESRTNHSSRRAGAARR